MSNHLIKMTIDDDREEIEIEDQAWCLSDPAPHRGTSRVLCTGAVLDIDTDAQWETKTVKRGGITCKKCIDIIKAYKSIKL